jgi:hypothetical protein
MKSPGGKVRQRLPVLFDPDELSDSSIIRTETFVFIFARVWRLPASIARILLLESPCPWPSRIRLRIIRVDGLGIGI